MQPARYPGDRPVTEPPEGHVAVVIPHYTREAGILTRTLRHVFAQRNAPPVHVILVDDESPISAASEVLPLTEQERAAITIIRRPNGGTAKARNTGMAAVSDRAGFIALLDCDDMWREDHLSNAVAAMDLGCEFFFANNRRENAASDWFALCEFSGLDHTVIDEQRALYRVRGDLFGTILVKAPICGSTVVMRHDKFGSFRFEEDMGTCDDLYFWLEVVRCTDKIGFSPNEHTIMGDAINQSVIDHWRSAKALRLVYGGLMFAVKVRQTFSLTPEQTRIVDAIIRANREGFLKTAFSLVIRGIRFDYSSVHQCVRSDPGIWRALPAMIASFLVRPFRAHVRSEN